MDRDIEEIQNKAAQVPVKFNAWHKEQKKMYLAEDLSRISLTLMPDGSGFANILSGIDNDKRMIPLQYIGRTDCKGVELYHGDIVECYCQSRGRILRGWIESSFGGFRLEGPIFDLGGIDNAFFGPLKKVGTIFESPELLE